MNTAPRITADLSGLAYDLSALVTEIHSIAMAADGLLPAAPEGEDYRRDPWRAFGGILGALARLSEQAEAMSEQLADGIGAAVRAHALEGGQ